MCIDWIKWKLHRLDIVCSIHSVPSRNGERENTNKD